MATKHTHFDSTEFNTLRNSAIPAAIMASPNTRFDSAEEASVFFARELDHVKAKTYDVEYPELTALSNFPISSEADAGDNTITYYTYDKTGLAKVIDNYSTDLPRADATGKPSIALIKSVGDSYGYSAQEMRASRRAGKSLDVRKAESARYQIDNLINKIAWRGDEESGLMGVLSAGQNIPLYTITAGADSSKTTWLEKTADEILLDVNYRCTSYILKGAVRVIEHNKKRYPKKLRAVKDKGALVHVQEVKDPTEEAKYIISSIQKRMEEGKDLKDMAVLFRTNLDAGILAGQLMEHRLPFSMREYVRNVFEHFIGRNIRSYMELASGRRDRKYFLDIANCPRRYISRESMEHPAVSFEELRKFYCDKDWMQDRIDQFEWDIKMMENKTPFAALQYIRKRIGYDEYLREWAKTRRVGEEDLFEILEQIQESTKDFQTMEEWFRYTDEYGRNLREQQRRKSAENREGISLMTMHSAKGLEFDTVFILDANEGVTPYKKAKLEEEIEEERRMFYVAMTRAKEKLVITYVKTKNGKDADPSRFVEELLLRGKKKKDA